MNDIFTIENNYENSSSSIKTGSGKLYLQQNDGTGSTIIKFEDNSLSTLEFLIPFKPSGSYTLATLDDIKKIDLTGRVYENNAAAISGGLTTNDVYRTSTGELRIVV